jgi:hypothetical protein
MSIVYYFLYSLNSMMDLASLKDSKSPNPQWGTSEKGSRIMIAPPFVYIHSISLSLALYYMLILYLLKSYVILLSYMSMHLHYLYIISYAIFLYHISSLCVIHFDALLAW